MDVENSAAPGLKDRTKIQGELCLEEAKVALQKSMDVVSESMANEQKRSHGVSHRMYRTNSLLDMIEQWKSEAQGVWRDKR